jgi:beta-ribofuranosylaminobenzene 5'-phosphate synthase
MGFIDLSGALGRHFGSIGVALNEQATRLTVAGADRRSISGPSAARAEKCLTRLCEAFGVSDALAIRIESAIPEHVGLGSGTQMSLAIGAALNAFYDLGLNVRDIAKVMVRGQRSGIGIGVFEQGGLVVDGGRGEHTVTPPLLVRMALPEAWRFILVFDRRGQGLHGLQEIQAFQALPLFPRREAEQLCYLLLMQALPAVAENDIARFGEVITRLQRSVGEHFAAVQGGLYTSPEVAAAMQWLAEQGAVAVGQTSWGPTGFCMVNGADRATALIEMAERKFGGDGTLIFSSASARNSSGLVVVE